MLPYEKKRKLKETNEIYNVTANIVFPTNWMLEGVSSGYTNQIIFQIDISNQVYRKQK